MRNCRKNVKLFCRKSELIVGKFFELSSEKLTENPLKKCIEIKKILGTFRNIVNIKQSPVEIWSKLKKKLPT